MTLHRDDRRAEAIFQTDFKDGVPQVIYGIGGYEFDLQARAPVHQPSHGSHGGYGGYGSYGSYGGGRYGHSVEPNAVGVYVTAHATPDSVTFQTINLGFGDSDLLSVKVNYQACSINAYIETD